MLIVSWCVPPESSVKGAFWSGRATHVLLVLSYMRVSSIGPAIVLVVETTPEPAQQEPVCSGIDLDASSAEAGETPGSSATHSP